MGPSDEVVAKAAGTVRYAADGLPGPIGHARVVLAGRAATRIEVRLAAARRAPAVLVALGPDDDDSRAWSSNPHATTAEQRTLTASPGWPGAVVGVIVAETGGAAENAAASVEVVVRDLAPTGGDEVDEVWAVGVGPPPERPAVVRTEVVIEPGPHAPMERPTAAARWSEDGVVTVWSSTQTPDLVRQRLEDAFDLAPGTVDMAPVWVGGGFGLKEDVLLEPLAVLAARRVPGRTVLLEVTRRQLAALRSRFPAMATVTSGGPEDVDVALDVMAGAVRGHAADVATNGLYLSLAAYPGLVATGRARVHTGPGRPGAGFRGYGGLEAVTALERHVDELARRSGIGGIAWRRAHASVSRRLDPRGEPVGPLQLDACLRRLEAAAGERGRPPLSAGPGRWARGCGVAAAVDTSGAAQSPEMPDTSVVELAVVDQRVVVTTSVPDMGTGILDVLGRVVAGELGLGRRLVRVCRGALPHGRVDPGAFGSRTARVVAAAAVDGAVSLRDVAGSIDDRVGLALLLAAGRLDGQVVVGCHTSLGPALSASAVSVEVEVDRATGVVRPRQVVSVLDVGTVLDPMRAQGQVVGGVVQGLGVALHEVEAPTLLGQGLTSSVADVAIEVHFVSPPPSDPAPRGLGELAIMAVPGAVLNAVRDAVGSAPGHLPATPDRVLAAMAEAADHGHRS